MFSKKSDEKFEDDFKKLFIITNDLNQRLLNLERQNHLLLLRNQSLEGELNEIKYNINWNRQNLENRITDFTDMWHPLMTDNINRIKKSLEETVMAKENLDIIKIQSELEIKITNRIKKSLEETIMAKEATYITKIQSELEIKITKITNIIKESSVEQLSDYILIGFKDGETLPVFIHKNSNSQAIYKFRNTDSVKAFHNAWGGAVLIAQSLKYLKNIKTYDICSLQNLKITDIDSNIIYNPSELNCGCPDSFGKPRTQLLSLEQMCDKRNLKFLKNLLNVFDEMGIKLIMNDSEFIKGVSIKTLINQS